MCATHLDPIHNWVLTLGDIVQTQHQPPPLPDEVCYLNQRGHRQCVPAHHKQEHTAPVLCLPLDGDQLSVPLWDLRIEVGDTMLPVCDVCADTLIVFCSILYHIVHRGKPGRSCHM